MKFCKWEMYFWLLIALLVFLGSCTSSETQDFNIYFDTKDYIIDEANDILNVNSQYTNSVLLNGQKEVIENNMLDSAALSEMIVLFTKANINKKIFKGQYDIDTLIVEDTETSNEEMVIIYHTQNDKLDVKWVKKYSNGNLKAMLSNSTFLFSYEKELFYEKNKRFTIDSWQKILGQDTLIVHTEYVFLP